MRNFCVLFLLVVLASYASNSSHVKLLIELGRPWDVI